MVRAMWNFAKANLDITYAYVMIRYICDCQDTNLDNHIHMHQHQMQLSSHPPPLNPNSLCVYCTVGHLCHIFYFPYKMWCSKYRFNLIKVPTNSWSIVWKWLDVISTTSQVWMQFPIVRISTIAHFQLFLFSRKQLWRLLIITMGNTCHPLKGVLCGTI